MSGGTAEIHTDADYTMTGTHQGASGAASFVHRGYHFDTFLKLGVYAENVTQSTGGLITAISDHDITVDGVTWDYGDTIKVYKTATKGSLISTQWVDVSRGWKTPMKELEDGWRPEDVDLNSDGAREVWGPGQPENYRK